VPHSRTLKQISCCAFPSVFLALSSTSPASLISAEWNGADVRESTPSCCWGCRFRTHPAPALVPTGAARQEMLPIAVAAVRGTDPGALGTASRAVGILACRAMRQNCYQGRLQGPEGIMRQPNAQRPTRRLARRAVLAAIAFVGV